jgi:hypothetical protein
MQRDQVYWLLYTLLAQVLMTLCLTWTGVTTRGGGGAVAEEMARMGATEITASILMP